jgi:hypothetical protein
LTRGEACEPPTTNVIESRIAAPVVSPGVKQIADADCVSFDMDSHSELPSHNDVL